MITRSSSRRTFIAKPRQALLAFLSKLAILIFVSLLWVSPADAQTGTSVDPFTHTSQAAYVTTSGRYTFNLGNGAFQADVDVAEGGAWILIGQYFHKGGTNPNLTVLAAGADFPVRSTAPLGTDEGAITAKWGHAGNAAMAQFTGDVELRFYGVTSGHGRIIHFKTPEGSDYVKTGVGNFAAIKTNFTALSGHTSLLPASRNNGFSNKGNSALTNFPFYRGGADHWGIKGNNSRWEVDDYPNNGSRDTQHQIWARTTSLVDNSDTPSNYHQAAHSILGGTQIGVAVDADSGSIASANANGDGADDDGVTLPTLIQDMISYIDVEVAGTGSHYLQGWIDYNGDGDFDDAGEQVITDLTDNAALDLKASTAGTIRVAVRAPATATTSQTFARFRWSSTAGLNATDTASDGEVEDYALTIEPKFTATAQCSVTFENIALTATPTMSSEYGSTYNRNRSNDGNKDGSNASISKNGYANWLDMDLGSVQSIDAINVWNRSTNPERLDSFYVFISNTPFPNTGTTAVGWGDDLMSVTNDPNVIKYQNPAGTPPANTLVPFSTTGRYVRVQLPAETKTVIQISELEVNSCAQDDRSDAPASYGEATHGMVAGFQLGVAIDGEASSLASANADGDGADDDGVILPVLTQSANADILVTVTQVAANDGYLQGWIDWNGDGDFSDSGEQVCTDLQYGAGTSGTITVAVTTPVTAATTQTFARFRWSTTAGLDSTSAADSGEVEDYAFTITAGGKLAARKEVEVWDPSSAGLYAIPGNDVRYTLSADNTGAGPIDTDTIVMIDEIPENVILYNGDVDDTGSETQPVSFSQTSGAGLTFTYATDVAFSDSADKPVNFAACLYTPSSGYDINVTYICINPKGALAAGTPTPSFSVNFRAQIQ